MKIEFNLKKINLSKKGKEQGCLISYEKGTEPCVLTYTDIEFCEKNFEGVDLFDALNNLRLFLESEGWLLICTGSRIDAYPSGMSRQMSNGRKAYLHEMNVKPEKKSVVDIFTNAPLEKIGTINEQNKYMEEWRNSI